MEIDKYIAATRRYALSLMVLFSAAAYVLAEYSAARDNYNRLEHTALAYHLLAATPADRVEVSIDSAGKGAFDQEEDEWDGFSPDLTVVDNILAQDYESRFRWKGYLKITGVGTMSLIRHLSGSSVHKSGVSFFRSLWNYETYAEMGDTMVQVYEIGGPGSSTGPFEVVVVSGFPTGAGLLDGSSGALTSSAETAAYLVPSGEDPLTLSELSAITVDLAHWWQAAESTPEEAFRAVNAKWENRRDMAPIFGLSVSTVPAGILILLVSSWLGLALASTVRYIASAKTNDRTEPWLYLDAVTSQAKGGLFCGWTLFLEKLFGGIAYKVIPALPFLTGVVVCSLLYESQQGLPLLITAGTVSVINLVPAYSTLNRLRGIRVRESLEAAAEN